MWVTKKRHEYFAFSFVLSNKGHYFFPSSALVFLLCQTLVGLTLNGRLSLSHRSTSFIRFANIRSLINKRCFYGLSCSCDTSYISKPSILLRKVVQSWLDADWMNLSPPKSPFNSNSLLGLLFIMVQYFSFPWVHFTFGCAVVVFCWMYIIMMYLLHLTSCESDLLLIALYNCCLIKPVTKTKQRVRRLFSGSGHIPASLNCL